MNRKFFLPFLFVFLLIWAFAAGPAFSETDVCYGILSKFQFNPPYILLSTAGGAKKFAWLIDETIFIGDDNVKFTPQQFAKVCSGKTVEVVAEGYKAKIVRRVLF